MNPLRSVTVVGTGLIGTSVGLALVSRGVTPYLVDSDPGIAGMAADLGAGRPGPPSAPADLAVLAVPPAAVGGVLKDLQDRDFARAYTDVSSVKSVPCRVAKDVGCELSTFVGGHPLAGRERSGPGSARADIFEGRPWVLTPSPLTTSETLALARELVELCGGLPVVMDPDRHDHAVALVSHAPHLISGLMAARLAGAEEAALRLCGQGVRDVTRLAAGDPQLWADILASNAEAVADVLESLSSDLGVAVQALRAHAGDHSGGRERLAGVLRRGNAGRDRIPGKHGTPPARYSIVPVVLTDRPGGLARLFSHVGEAGINIEDVTIEHSPGQPVGLVQLAVKPATADSVTAELRRRGWTVHQSQTPTPLQTMVVAVDGPSGSGKSSVSRGVAVRLGLRYLDTGAMYRAVTWWMLEHGVDTGDPDAVAAHAGRPELEVGTDPETPTVAVAGVDVSGPIRTRAVTAAVSAVSAVPDVRRRLVALQRELIGDGGIVVEGRDIGTVVAPGAPVKAFLTASTGVRAQRRRAELAHDPAVTVHGTRQEITRRDRLDSGRSASPLVKASDAHEIDATDLSLEQVIDVVVHLVLDQAAS